jgi:hypothetical protein
MFQGSNNVAAKALVDGLVACVVMAMLLAGWRGAYEVELLRSGERRVAGFSK